MFDLIIKGGTVFDGTGAEGKRLDVGVRDGLIAEVGDLGGQRATAHLDADGAIVTPGFVDVHTHYDGQVTWDPELEPSALHGVTTAVMGNCGIGFAPARAEHRTQLIELMEGVEDIPGAALAEGLTWEWESFGEYLDAIARKSRTIDVAGQVPHDALRVYVMGERGLCREQATEDDLARMKALLSGALRAGAIGFSTGRTDNHRSARGDETPAAQASARELEVLASAFADGRHGVLQVVSDYDLAAGPAHFDAEFDVVRRLAAAAGGKNVSLSLLQRDQDVAQWERILTEVERCASQGMPMFVQVAARAIGVMLGLDTTFHPFVGFPSYRKIAHLPLEERKALMQQPTFKTQLLSEKHERLSGDTSVPPLADLLLAKLEQISLRMFRMSRGALSYEPEMETSIYAEAFGAKRGVLEYLYDIVASGELIYFPLYNYTKFNLDDVRRMLTHPRSLFGLSDAGAHVGTVCDASFPTFLLSYWGRDRGASQHGVDPRDPSARGLALPFLVERLTSRNARYLGLEDRGVIAVGKKADLNVIDHAQLGLSTPRLVHDLPAGGKRLLQGASGYRATLVSGVAIARDGRLTGERPGCVVRGRG